MPINKLIPVSLSSFEGKNTLQNQTEATANTLLTAKNVLVLADNQMRRAPGYTQVAAVGAGPVYSVYDFQRSVDGTQFVFVHSGSEIIAMNADGTNQIVLATGESSAPHVFVQNTFNCYSSNGTNAYRYVDNNGTLTRYNWGIVAPLDAPAVSTSGGSLTLTYGRQYVYCYVSKYTDSIGVQRVHVSAPSPLSAFSGPITDGIVELTDIVPSTDPQVTHIWIFATVDSPVNTSATYFFMVEITNATTSYGDFNLDADLDQTQIAPYGNGPMPPSAILTTFQNCIWAGNGGMIRYSGSPAQILVGIPEEAWPVDSFFNIPSGTRTITAMTPLLQGSLLGVLTDSEWYGYSGTATTGFVEQDRIATPGATGVRAICTTPFGVAWMSPSQRIFMWNGNGSTTEVSANIMYQYPGNGLPLQTYSMEDLSAPDLDRVQLQWYSFGRLHFLACFARTSDAPAAYLNLIQIWSIPIKSSQSSGEYTGSSAFYNQIGGIYETDKLPPVSLNASGIVKVDFTPYIYIGDATGNVYRFPDGFQDSVGSALQTYESNFSTTWQELGVPGRKRFYWVDLFVEAPVSLLDAGGPVNNYKVFAAVSESPDDTPNFVPLALQLIPSPTGKSQYAIRANMQVKGANVGRYVRLQVTFPQDTNDQVLLKVVTNFAALPISGGG